MAIQHTWKITRMDSWVENKLVFNVHFAIETIDTDKPPYKMIQNMAVFVPHNPATPDVPYAELTEAIVIEWVKEELKIYQLNDDSSFVLDADGKRIVIGDSVPDILASGERQLSELINPVVETVELPWIKGE